MTDPAPAPVMVAPAMAAQHSPAPLQPAPIIRQPKLEEAEIASSYAKIRFPEFDSEDVETCLLPKKVVRFSLHSHTYPGRDTLINPAETVSTSYNAPSSQQRSSNSLPLQASPTLNTTSTSIKLNPGKAEVIERIYVNDSRTNNRFLIDTGAEISVIPPSAKDRMNPMPARKLFAANGSSIDIRGRKSEISIDRLKAAFMMNDESPIQSTTPVDEENNLLAKTTDPLATRTAVHQTRYGRKIYLPDKF
ncbi:uncharacterized protein LOC120906237 [Anopheles arabiensis]|uniref:uncharacterized protein LOC120906237 n=1 Tax=Anopheles arabiensis TaxID=7173 RepID=UPI001AADFD0F|nr:uncharacterized protein LOC120906237 [Anopheles arabiensis]